MIRRLIIMGSALMILAILLAACSSTSGPLAVGNKAPGFSLTDSNGNKVTLADYRGQPVLLFFHMAGG